MIVVDGEAPEGTLRARRGRGIGRRASTSRPRSRRSSRRDVLTLIYTSGTTGPPKGVQLMHRNLLAAVEGLDELISSPATGASSRGCRARTSQSATAHHYLPIVYGLQITCCDDPRQVLSYLPEVRPSWFFAVPRIWEKLKAGLETMLASQPEERQQPMRDALRGNRARCAWSSAGRRCPPSSPSRWRRPTRRSSPGCGRCSGSTRSRRSTSARRPRRSRCSSSSTRSGCRSRSCGA